MAPESLKQWRHALGLSQRAAAEALGVSPRMLSYYERGERDGHTVEIPRTVALACTALYHRMEPYGG